MQSDLLSHSSSGFVKGRKEIETYDNCENGKIKGSRYTEIVGA